MFTLQNLPKSISVPRIPCQEYCNPFFTSTTSPFSLVKVDWIFVGAESNPLKRLTTSLSEDTEVKF